jgi:hypothetical protein
VVTEVQIDCTQQTARYVKAAFYAQPDFRGQPFKVTVYAGDDIRPMIFKDITDDPNARIIKAACSAKSVTSNCGAGAQADLVDHDQLALDAA